MFIFMVLKWLWYIFVFCWYCYVGFGFSKTCGYMYGVDIKISNIRVSKFLLNLNTLCYHHIFHCFKYLHYTKHCINLYRNQFFSPLSPQCV